MSQLFLLGEEYIVYLRVRELVVCLYTYITGLSLMLLWGYLVLYVVIG